MSGKVIAINISEKKGVMKKPIPAGNFIENFGHFFMQNFKLNS